MVQATDQTKEEKIKMYMKSSKKKLAEMLWAANVLIDSIEPEYKDASHNYESIVPMHIK